ncbi:MAG TPA: chorismate-binding protein [Chryseolinea sp.]|nr:chorismate-binding protein [Chryseolinea sp.]HPH47048.1 chorismate-binding protein [Chryseolinea sp.]HPM32133.1 chorismate-binding protein [Chryseolinea sp.]
MDTLVSEKSSPLTEIDYLSRIITHAVDQHFSVALWKLPNNPVRQLVLSRQTQLLKKNETIEELKTGFIFSPFDPERESLYLEADFSFSFSQNELRPPETPSEITSAEWLKNVIRSSSTTRFKTKFHNQVKIDEQGEQKFYVNLVSRGIAELEKGSMEKIVLSRTLSVLLPDDVDVVNVFEELCDTYPDAMVSFISSPEAGTWMGATPEVLVGLEDNTIFKTVALAGTKTFQEDVNLKTVAWTQKEIEEQALVERYIISCFKKIRLREYDEHGPKTIVAGNVLHLKSEFTVDMKATNFPQLGSVMLQLLHPTSAVCGMPLEYALKFLKDHEGYDRQYYAGYLGPVNFNNQTSLFVNLRCMQLQDDRALLYAGAGVTIDSDPKEEWIETEMKLNTLLKVIHHTQ